MASKLELIKSFEGKQNDLAASLNSISLQLRSSQIENKRRQFQAYYAPVHVSPTGGVGCAGRGWGFDKGTKILVNFPREGQHMFTKCSSKSPPRDKKSK